MTATRYFFAIDLPSNYRPSLHPGCTICRIVGSTEVPSPTVRMPENHRANNLLSVASFAPDARCAHACRTTAADRRREEPLQGDLTPRRRRRLLRGPGEALAGRASPDDGHQRRGPQATAVDPRRPT